MIETLLHSANCIETDQQRRTFARALFAVALVSVLATAALAGAPADVAAQSNDTTINDTAPYYDNHTASVDNGSWLQGNEDGNDPGALITMLTRVGTFVIGGDGAGSGAFLTGMLLFGGTLGLAVDAQVGMVGGGVLSVLALFGVVSVGLAPAWLTPVAMFGVALLLSSSAQRVLG